ncbi:hypothetical protein N9D72_03570 [Porticoccaceae bacterium]|nr:hypothetical protein [Porticoccaceae bacterium]
MSFSNSKVRITMFRSVFIFLLSFFGSNTGSVASEGWVVPSKQLSAASGLSDETRQLMTALGASQFDMRKMKLDGDLRQGLLGIAEQVVLQQKHITIEAHESQFGVKIQASEIAGVKVYKISPPQINSAFEGRIFMHTKNQFSISGALIKIVHSQCPAILIIDIEVIGCKWKIDKISKSLVRRSKNFHWVSNKLIIKRFCCGIRQCCSNEVY